MEGLTKKEYLRQYYLKNRDRLKAKTRAYYVKNRQSVIDREQRYADKNRQKVNGYKKKYVSENKDKRRAYERNRRKTDPLFKLKITCRGRVRMALKSKSMRKSNPTVQILGAEIKVVKLHIEKLFSEGMGWDNHGEWEIDHRIPLASANTESEILNLCHYTNLQPLWKLDNKKKSDKII